MCTVQDVRQKFPDWPHGMLTTYNAVVPLGTTGLLYHCSVVVPEYGVFRQDISVYLSRVCSLIIYAQ